MARKIIPVILSGGSGKRLWPLSRENYPKQFLALHSDKPLLVEAAERVRGELFEKPIIIAHEAHRFIIAELMEAAGLDYEILIIEPEAKNTAAPIHIAALHVQKVHGAEAILLVVTSDHVIEDRDRFNDTIARASEIAADSRLLCVGIPPAHADTGYGYIKQGTAIDKKKNIYEVETFTEKPNLKTAQKYLEEGGYFWNSGMYMARADLLIQEMRVWAPDIAEQAGIAYEKSESDLHFLRLDRAEFSKLRAQSIDKAVTEVTKNAAFVVGDFYWADLGSYFKLWQEKPKDEDGNAIVGAGVLKDCKNNFVYSEGPLVVSMGTEDLIIVADKDVTLVLPKKLDQQLDGLVGILKAQGRKEVKVHEIDYRPWGWFRNLAIGDRFHTKILEVKPGKRLSLQKHHHRSEHWICVKGTAEVDLDDKKITLYENQSVYIPVGSVHRLSNPGKIPVQIIEIQTGSYFEEDDIIRIEDDFVRQAHET